MHGHCENQDSIEKDGEESEEDSDCGPESHYKSESDKICIDDDNDDDLPPDLQEALDDSESNSNDEWANKTFIDVPDSQVKKCHTTII